MTLSMQKKSLCQQLLEKEESCGGSVYLRQAHEGRWHELTWQAVMRQARQVANFITNLGLKRGDRVSIFSKNCAEWLIADFGITLAGMVNVPLFPNQNQQTIEYILEHAEVKLVFLGKLDSHLRTRTYIPQHVPTINFPYHLDLEATYQWTSILDTSPIQHIEIPSPEDIYTIIYSSGTTGQPKGIVFTQDAIANYLVSLWGDLQRLVPVNMRHHLLSYLPLAHVYERSTVQLASLIIDSDVSFVESLDKFAKNLQEVQPTMFTAVPRIWCLFKQRVEQPIEKKRLGWILKLPLISRVITRKIKQQLGLSRCCLCVSGAAHLPMNVVGFFKDLGIIIQEGSGQTEDLGYTTLSQRYDIKPGWVGTPRFDVQIKQTDQGELLVYSPFLMKEYYKEPTLSRDSFDADGWLKTGDLVEIDEYNRVKILGRLSENFKNQKGEFVTPSAIEDQFIVAPLIEQCCLVGKMLPSNVLLVNLANVEKMASESEIKDALRKLQHDVNRKLKIHEKISHILVVKEPWTITNHCLTPTMKIRRRMIETIHQDLIQSVVSMPVGVVWQ
jgi:long-chain acyl-CoA synthetase